MTESDTNAQTQMVDEEKLKYLEFVQTLTLHALMMFSRMYVYAKDNAGPLKPSVETVEGTVKSVVGPVYNKYHDVPIELLKFVDHKVDVSVNEIDRRVPPLVKNLSSQALSVAQKAPSTARAVTTEVQKVNVVDKASGLAKNVYAKYEPTAKGLYTKYEPVAEQYAASAWHSLHRLPLFPSVANAVVPKAAYCTEKYNQTVALSAEKGYKIAAFLPLVPTKRIAEVFADVGVEGEVSA